MKTKQLWRRFGIAAGTVLLVLLLLALLASSAFASDPDRVFDVAVEAGAQYDGYIFKLKDDMTHAMDLDSDTDLDAVNEERGIYTAGTVEEIQDQFSSREIEYIEPNYWMEAQESVNDPYYVSNNQWGLVSTDADAVLAQIQNGEITAANATVAVADSGLSTSHEDFDMTRITGVSFVDPDNTDMTEVGGHGTKVTSVIAATTNNAKGIASLGYGANVIAMKGAVAVEGKVGMYNATMAEIIYAAVDDYDCDVINISYGGPRYDAALDEACQYAYENCVIICAAVGNDGDSTMNYPAAFDSVIGVGATDSGGKAGYSNYNSSVYVAAPGSAICVATYSSQISYSVSSGTSYSSPFVASLAVLAKSMDKEMTVEEFKTLLRETSTDMGAAGYDEYFGWGVVNCEELVDRLTSPYEITLTQTEGGIISGPDTAEARETVTLTATPAAGYRLDHWEVISGDMIIEDDQFAMPRSDVEIQAVFVKVNYSVTVTATAGGSVSTAAATAQYGDVITLTAEPEAGYTFDHWVYTGATTASATVTPAAFTVEGDTTIQAVFDTCYQVNITTYPKNATVTVLDGNGDEVLPGDDGIYRLENGDYTYVAGMPGYVTQSEGFTVNAQNRGPGHITLTADVDLSTYEDVDQDQWYKNAVEYSIANNLFVGSGSKWEPDTALSRAMFVTVLGKHFGIQNSDYATCEFDDVNDGEWYTGFVQWAVNEGLVVGTGNNRFSPDDIITRQEMAVIFWKYVNKTGVNMAASDRAYKSFPDYTDTDNWAETAMIWATGSGMINGSDGNLLPKGTASRAEAAQIFMRIIEDIL